jgi:uncharacterized protein YndB with AHSA1/START domain
MTEPAPNIDTDELGVLERDGDVAVLRYRRHLAQPPVTVWRAMSEPAQLAGWFPTTIEGEQRPGASLQFAFRGVDMDPMAGVMLAFEPPALLELRWGDDTLRFELFEEGAGTRLDLTVRFGEVGKAARDGAGWHVCLARLVPVLDASDLPAWEEDDGWRAIHPRYVSALGPEASRIGPPEAWEDVHGPA